jgi:hypothetical protein
MNAKRLVSSFAVPHRHLLTQQQITVEAAVLVQKLLAAAQVIWHSPKSVDK